MPYQLVLQRVKDYKQWKAVFDEHINKRKELGSKGAKIFRNSERPDEVLVLVEWGDLSKAREFMKWGDPNETRKKAGLIGQPDVYLLEHVATVVA
jgi:heme-degrading monooxygenase HmoA